MIDRKQLKKGDHVLMITNICLSNIPVRPTFLKLVVISTGTKYIACQNIDDNGKVYGSVKKFYNNEQLSMLNRSAARLFLGTEEELNNHFENEKQCGQLFNEIMCSISKELGFNKLKAIKAIIDSDNLENTLLELSPVKPACA